MEVRKPLNLPQLKLVTSITDIVSELNPELQLEYDLTIMNPVIAAVNQMIKEIKAQGDVLFKCDCIDEHDLDCSLVNDKVYDVTDKYNIHWECLLSILERQDVNTPMSWDELRAGIPVVIGGFKAIISEALKRGLLVRDSEGWFYKT